MSEKSFWTLARNNLRLKMWRVENKVMKGMPDVQYLLGHSSTQITQRYVDAQFTSNNQYINEAMLKINKLDNE